MTMQWSTLLSTVDQEGNHFTCGERFSMDLQSLTFSSAFRRLAGKTQVFSLTSNDYVRNRLTHTMEVSDLARRLGHKAGKVLIERHKLVDIHRTNIGLLLAAAGIAHDLGHPPLAHAGEEAIRDWMSGSPVAAKLLSTLSPCQRLELENFEGNAQNYRLVQQFSSKLSYATLATFSKYLCPADFVPTHEQSKYIGFKKYGYFESERGLIQNMADALGLHSVQSGVWLRHPLAYLLEAADDICYRLVDMEDAAFMGISKEEALDLLRPLADPNIVVSGSKQVQIEQLRASAMSRIADEAIQVFLDCEDAIRNGSFKGDILDHIPHAREMRKLTEFAHAKIYVDKKAAEMRAVGFGILEDLLDYFGEALYDIHTRGDKARHKSISAMNLIPEEYRTEKPVSDLSAYDLVHVLTDFVGSLTDTMAVSLSQKINGVSLPTH